LYIVDRIMIAVRAQIKQSRVEDGTGLALSDRQRTPGVGTSNRVLRAGLEYSVSLSPPRA